jgi:hypothetical protein
MDDYGPAHTHEARKCRGMSSTLAGEEGAPAISVRVWSNLLALIQQEITRCYRNVHESSMDLDYKFQAFRLGRE